MDEYTIKALLELNLGPVCTEGKKVLLIPYEDVLRGKISIHFNKIDENAVGNKVPLAKLLTPPPPVPAKAELDTAPEVSPEDEINIPMEIVKLYPTETLRDNMIQDVSDYLKEISKCWEYHNLGFTKSLLKKAAKARPALNGVVFAAYGKEGDAILEAVVKLNMPYIRECWNNYSPLDED